MIELPVWNTCKRCTRFFPSDKEARCIDPFPASGVCPHADDRQLTINHPFSFRPDYANKYARFLSEDARLASIFHRWRRGDIPKDADFLYLREQVLHPSRFMHDDDLMFFIYDILHAALVETASDFAAYHLGVAKPEDRPGPLDESYVNQIHSIMETIQGCVGVAVFGAFPLFLEPYAKLGGEWTRLVLDLMRYLLWGLYKCKHIDFSNTPDHEFRRQFEQEWRILRTYHDLFYGFNVVPKLSLTDMVRYQKLPKGDAGIRGDISVYLTHQATEYPHWIKLWAPNFTEVAFERRIRESYTALIHSLTKTAVRNLASVAGGSTISDTDLASGRQKLEQDIERQLWQQYDEARSEFEFYWDYPGKVRPIGKMGLVDFPQNRQTREKVDTILKTWGALYTARDFSEIGFAHFIQLRLRHWVNDAYPADAPRTGDVSLDATPANEGATLGEQLSGENSWNFDDNEVVETKPAVIGPDGTPYITIHQTAVRAGIGVLQLRRLDKLGILPSVRVKDVCGTHPSLNADVRLYPLTPEGDQARRVAKARLAKHSSRLSGEEVDRETASTITGVPVSTLRKWEKKLLIQPKRKGKIVVYDGETLEQARQIKARKAASEADSHSGF